MQWVGGGGRGVGEGVRNSMEGDEGVTGLWNCYILGGGCYFGLEC